MSNQLRAHPEFCHVNGKRPDVRFIAYTNEQRLPALSVAKASLTRPESQNSRVWTESLRQHCVPCEKPVVRAAAACVALRISRTSRASRGEYAKLLRDPSD